MESIRAVRSRTGATLVQCKFAVADADGDIDAAVALIEERGQAVPENLELPERTAPVATHSAVATPTSGQPALVADDVDETPLIEAIRARDVARTHALLEGREVLSAQVLSKAVAYGTGIERILALPVAGLASSGHGIARLLSKSVLQKPRRAAVLGKLLDAMPRGLKRTDAMAVGLGPVAADTMLPEIPGVRIARRGIKLAGAVGDVAVLVDDTRCVEVREAPTAEDALAIVEQWMGHAPKAPRGFESHATAATAIAARAGNAPLGERVFTEGLAPAVVAQIQRLGGTLPASAKAAVVQTESGPVELSAALSLFCTVTWPQSELVFGDPPRAGGFTAGELAEPGLARGYAGPLLIVAADDLHYQYVVRVHEDSADPMVCSLDHDGSSRLDLGWPLSEFLERMAR